MRVEHSPAVYKAAASFYEGSPTGQYDFEAEHALRCHFELLEALQDMLAGWKYIRSFHGDLYGVGWDRAQNKADAAIAKALGETK